MKKTWFLIFPSLIATFGCASLRTFVKGESGGKDPTYYYLLSEIEAHRNDTGQALSYLDRALEKDPGQPHLWFKHASLEAATGNIRRSEEDLQKALAISPEDAASLVLLGKIYMSQDKRTAAIATYQRALKSDPKAEEAVVLLVEAYVADKKYDAALALIRQWQARMPESTAPLFYEAWLYQNFVKNPAGAINAYRKILTIEPDNMKALSSLADLYMATQATGKVLEIFGEMEALTPNNPTLLLKIALLYYEHKQYDQAIEKFREVLKSHPDAERIVYYLGVIYENLKRDREALAEFEKIKPSSSFYKDARLHMAYMKRRGSEGGATQGGTGEEDAIRLLEEAIAVQPRAAGFYEYLGEIYRDRRDFGKAIEILKRGISRSADKEPLHYSLGMVYDRAGRFDDCIGEMRRVLKLNPKNANAMNYIGYSYADRGVRLDEALQLVQKALEIKPDDGYITDSLGWVYFRRGDLERAGEYVLKAYTLVPGEPTIIEHLGDISLGRNDKPKALRFFREALSHMGKKHDKDSPEIEKDRERVKKKIEGLLK